MTCLAEFINWNDCRIWQPRRYILRNSPSCFVTQSTPPASEQWHPICQVSDYVTRVKVMMWKKETNRLETNRTRSQRMEHKARITAQQQQFGYTVSRTNPVQSISQVSNIFSPDMKWDFGFMRKYVLPIYLFAYYWRQLFPVPVIHLQPNLDSSRVRFCRLLMVHFDQMTNSICLVRGIDLKFIVFRDLRSGMTQCKVSSRNETYFFAGTN